MDFFDVLLLRLPQVIQSKAVLMIEEMRRERRKKMMIKKTCMKKHLQE